jgi:polyhydroxybutyrate depolymerase
MDTSTWRAAWQNPPMPTTLQTIAVAGSSRTFLLALPEGPADAVVLGLHGTRSSSADQIRLSRMESLATAGRAVVAFPEAVIPIGSGYQWDPATDMPFLVQLVETLLERHQPPAGRVCITGMSGGARMSCWFAAARADLVSCVGAVAGLRAAGEHPPSRQVPIVAFHGTADRINPYGGGNTPRWDESVRAAAERWAQANGVPGQPSEETVSPTLTRTTWGELGQPGEVTLWTAAGAGHTWPGSRLGIFLRLFLGRTNMEMGATKEIWEFAGRHAGDP